MKEEFTTYLAAKRFFTQLAEIGVPKATEILRDYEEHKITWGDFVAAFVIKQTYDDYLVYNEEPSANTVPSA